MRGRTVQFLFSCLVGVVGLLAPGSAAASPADEETLKQAGLATDAEALLQWFRDRTLTDNQRGRILALIARLGADAFDVRERATADLQTEGARAVALLRQVIGTRDADVEIVRRAETILEGLRPPSRTIAAAAARVLAGKKPANAPGVLLAFVPFADDSLVAEEVCAALAATAVRDGLPDRTVLRGLDDPSPVRRAAAAEALVRAGTASQRQELRRFLQDPDTQVRYQVALAFYERKEKAAVPALIDLLAELPADRAGRVEEVLCTIAGSQAPNAALGKDAASRKQCRDAWQAWWGAHGATLDLARLPDTPLLGFTLIVQIDPSNSVGKVVELDAHRRVRWQINGLHYPVDAHVIRHDRVLIAEYSGQRVTERNFQGEVLWEHRVHSPISVQRLADGSTFIASHNQLLIVDAAGKERVAHSRPNHDIIAATRLIDGQFFLVTNAGLGVRLDATGKETKSFMAGHVHQFAGLDALPGGKILVPQVSTGKVVEFDPDGKPGWQTAFAQASSAVRLPDGHTLVCSFNAQKIVELDATGKPVGAEYRPDGRPWKARKR
ncbi:hypothetical protein AYO44_11995 [Planctomycetaceae bacterium SCGC AG-212-F19]|nr:hypothetical protein AYO44_11995 [Planctomycetaceae bacterium SCGC AG-212-F19]